MITAFVFPGQGSFPHPRDLRAAQATTRGRALVEIAAREAELGSVSHFHARGGLALERASVLCPLLVALGLAQLPELEGASSARGVVLLGHSLGELSALAAAGAIEASDAITLAAERGRALDAAASAHPSGLYALARPDLERALALGEGQIAVALDNAEDEVVLGADDHTLRRLAERIPGRRLHVAGAFHTELMRPARAALASALRRVRVGPPRRPVLSAVTLRFLESPGEVATALLEGITKPVRLREAMSLLASLGRVDALILPPFGAVQALVRKNLGNATKWMPS
jgi:[acyl-carrier-protein] S-malonyltransferase